MAKRRERCLDPQKIKFGSEAEAQVEVDKIAQRWRGYRGLHPYKCCDHWHIGHTGKRGKGKWNRKKRGAWT